MARGATGKGSDTAGGPLYTAVEARGAPPWALATPAALAFKAWRGLPGVSRAGRRDQQSAHDARGRLGNWSPYFSRNASLSFRTRH